MTNVQDTSMYAYEEIKSSLGARQLEVFEALIMAEEPKTNCELGRLVGRPINCITPRTFELREMGLVREHGRRRCSITGRTAIAWELVPEQGTLL